VARRPSAPLDLEGLFRTLVRHKVRFIVIGGVAGGFHGSATLTRDLDVVYDRERENIRRLAAALTEMEANRRELPAGVSATIDERAILNGTNFLLNTRFGPLDCIGETPAERLTYAQLVVDAIRFTLAGDLIVAVTSLDDLIRMKQATGRERDRIEVERLTALRDEHELREAAGPYRRPRKGRPRRVALRRPGRRAPATSTSRSTSRRATRPRGTR
jgi:hypothetical protein